VRGGRDGSFAQKQGFFARTQGSFARIYGYLVLALHLLALSPLARLTLLQHLQREVLQDHTRPWCALDFSLRAYVLVVVCLQGWVRVLSLVERGKARVILIASKFGEPLCHDLYMIHTRTHT